jgi:predicted dithiol-disulfide oxidoreductase (DUF899 family)
VAADTSKNETGEEWLVVRRELLKAEKELTRATMSWRGGRGEPT